MDANPAGAQPRPPVTKRRFTGVRLLFASAAAAGAIASATHAVLDGSSASSDPSPAAAPAMLNGPTLDQDEPRLQNLTPQQTPAPAAAETDTAKNSDSLACKAAQANAVLSIKQLDAGLLNQALTVAAICTVTGK